MTPDAPVPPAPAPLPGEETKPDVPDLPESPSPAEPVPVSQVVTGRMM